MKTRFIAMTAVVAMFLLAGCGKKTTEVKIAISNDLLSGPIVVMEELNLIERYAPNAKVNAVISGSGTAINEAFIGNNVDGGILGITTFLVGIDNGIPYKVASPVSYSRLSIQTNNLDIKNLRDVSPDDKIALSSITGTTAMILYIAAEQHLGRWDALNDQIVLMNNNDATIALINNTGITLAVSDMTNRIKVNEAGCPTVLDNEDLSLDGSKMSILCVFNEDFHKKNEGTYEAFLTALGDAIKLLNDRDEQALDILARSVGIDKETIISYMDLGYLRYSMNMDGLDLSVLAGMAFKSGMVSSEKEIADFVFGK